LRQTPYVILGGLLLLSCFSSTAQAQPQPAPANTVAASTTTTAKTPPAYESDPKFISAMADAKKLVQQKEYHFAAEGYKKANKIAGGSCMKCLESVFDIQMAMLNFKDAIATSDQMISISTSPAEKSLAELCRGMALFRQGGDKPKPAQLEAAHVALQAALTDYPKNNAARYTEACVLARMGKMNEASEQFAACAQAASLNDPMRPRAKHFAENPSLSFAKMAPAFTVVSLDGKRFNLDEMGGRVVLIDFWATWCGPCNKELPHLKKIAKEFAGQPLVMISISWDSDEAKWKDFISKNEMTWVQYRDVDHRLSDMFGINSIPHYFTIDSDGVLNAETIGSGSLVEGNLRKLIKRANDANGAGSALSAAGSGAN